MWNVSSCSRWLLYVIVDRSAIGDRDPVAVASAAIRGGADAIQWRDKTTSREELTRAAGRLATVTRAAGVALIVNDHPEIAHAVGAAGVHLGQDDLPIQAAREIMGAGTLVGKSTHSVEPALAAVAEGADYIGLGPVFSTPTKPDYASIGLTIIPKVLEAVRVPVVCIGGIDQERLADVLHAGARCIAVVRAVCAASDPEAATRTLKQAITRSLVAMKVESEPNTELQTLL
jgi:thiamine-phosphate pyrophosphorylase